MIRPDLTGIPCVPMPAGYRARPVRLAEGDLWTEVVRDAEPYFDLADDLFTREFGQDLDAVPQRCSFIENEHGTVVGTISGWYDRLKGDRCVGRIHWVAVRPGWQGLGLGKAELAFALRRLARCHDRCLLTTQTLRVPAIRLYLNFGFLPDLGTAEACARWETAEAAIDHPRLTRELARVRAGGRPVRI
jgi:GNAT superfamily N-acetyltransferase